MPSITSRCRRWLVAALAIPFFLVPLRNVAAQPADTSKVSTEPLFTRRDAWLAMGFVVVTAAATPLDENIAQRLQSSGAQNETFFKDASKGVEFITAPGAFIIGAGLYATGRLTRHPRMADLGWHGTEAVLVGTAVYTIGKGVFGRARPETVDAKDPRSFKLGRGFTGGPYASFPSGHTTTAFAAASAVTAETSMWWPTSKWIIGPLMYGGATTVGLSRMYHNKHWASDVAMGALLGTFSGQKVVKYHHSHPNNRLDRIMLGRVSGHASVGFAPTGDLALVYTIRTP